MVASLLLAAIAKPLLDILWAQITIMLPGGEADEQRAASWAYNSVMQREPVFMAVQTALRDAGQGHPGPASAQSDSANGLYAYLQLSVFPPSTAPAEDAGLADCIRALRAVPPARLRAASRWVAFYEAAASAGMSSRVAARGANIADVKYGSLYRPVLRRLAEGLLSKGVAWREMGRPGDAAEAHLAVARLMLDLVNDSPRPDVVLLAIEYVPAALRELARESASAEDCLAQAAKVEAIRAKWQDGLSKGVNLLPLTGDVVLASKTHDRVLGSMLAAGYVIGTWLMLGAVCLVMLVWPPVIVFWRSRMTAEWRWRGWGRLAAVGIITGPMLIAAIVFLSCKLPLVWLFSLESLRGFVWPVLLVPVLVGLAAWLCVVLPEYARARLPRAAVMVMAVMALLVLVAAAMLPVRHESWRPPIGVQLFRRLGPWIGIESLALMLVWTIWGFVRRWRCKLKTGPRAAACLSVAVWAWLATSVIGLIVLEVNARNDAQHEAAFVTAAADPLTDRLGSGWREQNFGGVRELLARIQPPLR